MAGNRTCILCGRSYYYCPTCPNDAHLPKYMVSFHNQNCHDVFKAINDEFFGDITTAEAKKRLGELDLSDKDRYDKGVKASIARIMKANDPQKEDKKDESLNKGFGKIKK